MDQKAIIAIAIAAVVVIGGGVGIALALSNGGDSEASYTVKYNVNGGNAIEDKSFTKSTETFSLPDATRDGYTFLGWYGNADFTGEKITQVEKGTEKNIEVWAKWQLVLANNTKPTAAQITANTDVKVTFDSGATNEAKVIDNDVRDALTSGKTLTIEDTQQNLSWTFTGSDSKQAGYENQALNTAVTATKNAEQKKVTLAFDYEGKLPYASTIRYLFGIEYAGQQVTAVNENTPEQIIGPYTVDSQGYVEFPIDHCSDWTLSVSLTVRFDAAGGTINGEGSIVIIVPYKDAVGTLPTAKRTGYTFAAWTPAVTAETLITENATFTATWTENQYTVNFDKNSNDASGTMDPITVSYTGTQTIPVCTFANRGYTASWNTLANGSGTAIAAGGSITGQLASEAAGVDSLVVTLFAQWTANTYTATFDGNGGTVPATDVSKNIVYKTAYGALPAATREGYNLTGWNTAANGSGTAITAESIYDFPDNRTIYAQWELVTYTITYVMGEGATNNPGNPANYNCSQTVVFEAATKDGSAFMGWFKDSGYATGEVTTLTPGTSFGDLTLYAKWGNNNVTVSFTKDGAPMSVTGNVTINKDANSADMTLTSNTGVYYYETSTTFPITNTTYTIKVGDKTVGEVTVSNGRGTGYVYYYTVTFMKDETVLETQTVLKNDTASAPTSEPEKTGYHFTEWVSGAGSVWNFSNPVTATTQLRAMFAANTYTVTFAKGEGAGGSDSATATYDAVIPNVTIPERDGYDFIGYFLGDVKYIDEQGHGVKAWDRTSDTQLTAGWDVKKYRAAFNPNGKQIDGQIGEGWVMSEGMYVKSFVFGTTYQSIITDFGATASWSNHTFDGWTPATGTLGTEGVTFAPVLTPIEYTVIFSTNGGSGSVASVENVHFGSTLSQPAYDGTKTGFTNSGAWSYDMNGATPVNFTDGSLNVNYAVLAFVDSEHGTLTLYAKWNPINYKVNFDCNGGIGDAPPQLVNKHFGDEVSLVTPSVTKDGKFFGGWNTKADGTGTNYRGTATVDNSFIAFADDTTVTLYINWTDGLYTATVGDVFSGTDYQYAEGGDQVIFSAAWKAVVIWANASSYKVEMLISDGHGGWDSDGFATLSQGNYPMLYLDQDEGFAETMHESLPNTNYLQVSRNGATRLVTVSVYEHAHNGIGYMIAEDSDGICYQYRYSYGGGGMEYMDIMMELDTILEGEGNGYTPTAYSVSYLSAKNSETPIVSSDSTYKTPEQLGMQIPDGMVFVGWCLGDKNFYEGDEDELFQPGYVVTCAHTMYAIWTELVIDPTNIDWKVINLPEGITMTIGGEDAYESNGTQNGYVIFTGGDDWSKEQIDEGQYRYTFRLGETVYHAQIHKYRDAKITDAPDGNRMRIQFGANDSGQYTITIYFWMDMPHMNGYLAAVNDVFVYHQDVLGYGSDITCTVTEVGAHGTYDATVGDRSWDFRDYMYPFDSSGAINYLNYDEPGNSTQYAGVYVYSIESRTVLGAAKQCYVIKESVYTRSLVNERVELSEGIISEGLYGVDDGLLYLYTGPNSTTTLTSKPAEMGTVAQYPVTLNANGGRFSEEQPTCELGYAFTLEETTPRWTDNTFVKWNTRADGSGRDYVDGDRFNPADLVEGRIVLYAQWILDGFYVRVTGEGGVPLSVTIDKPYSSLNLGSVTYAPYDFGLITPPGGKAACAIGFLEGQYDTVTIANNNYSMHDNGDGTYNHSTDEGYRKVEGREVYYKSGGYQGYMWLQIIAYDAETVDLSLIWTTEVTAVTFHSNFGPDSTVVINYAVLDLYDGYFPAADLFERENYAFLGWATAADGNPQIPAGYTYDSSMGTEFWAIWAMSMTVTYNASGGNGSITDQTLILGNNNLSNGTGLSKAGYVIVGWATTENATTVAYPLGGKFVMQESQAGQTLDLFAVWATGTYTVRFNIAERGNGEFEGEMVNQVIGVGITTPLSALGYRDASGFYRFGYWVLSEDGSGPSYEDQEAVLNLAGDGETITLNAWWIATKYTVHYVLNRPVGTDWDNEPYDQLINVGVETALADCEFAGDEDYAFNGWNTASNGSGTSYANEAEVTDLTVGGDTFTLYAQWRSMKYTVQFAINIPRSPVQGSSFSETEVYSYVFTRDVPTNLPECEFEESSHIYTFRGWNTMADGSGTSYANGAEIVANLAPEGQTLTSLFAQWVLSTYTLVFYSGEDPEEREWADRGTMENQNRQVGDGLSLPACAFTPLDGVVFDHWEVDYGNDVTENFDAEYEGDITNVYCPLPLKVTAIWRLAEE